MNIFSTNFSKQNLNNGAILLKTYSHLNCQHCMCMRVCVSFSLLRCSLLFCFTPLSTFFPRVIRVSSISLFLIVSISLLFSLSICFPLSFYIYFFEDEILPFFATVVVVNFPLNDYLWSVALSNMRHRLPFWHYVNASNWFPQHIF